ncbi:radical SAM protein [Spirochaetota bacterium]
MALKEHTTSDSINIRINQKGQGKYKKVSYPVRYGEYIEVTDENYTYHFNLNGEIKFISGKKVTLPRNEWLKRTASNDWTYYSTEGYNSVCALIGEYYLPCFSYSPNMHSVNNPFEAVEVKRAFSSLGSLLDRLGKNIINNIPPEINKYLALIKRNNNKTLIEKAKELHKILGGKITVLPPDSRHVDYDVIPIIIADGCLYNCPFCIVKTGGVFKKRSEKNILEQMAGLKDFYSNDIKNYNSIFLGQNDALHTCKDIIEYTAKKAYEIFNLKNSNMKGANLFLFGSVDSLLGAPDTLFKMLNDSEYLTYINIGLESADQQTLDMIGKPIEIMKVKKAFKRIIEINKIYERVEVTSNFLIGRRLPKGHYMSIEELAKNCVEKPCPKGSIYLSSLNDGDTLRDTRKKVYAVKNTSKLPVYLYLIQRL